MSLEKLQGAVSSKILLTALDVSHRLAELNIPHAIIGGLAVGVHGTPRATKDVDFLVADEAFETTSPLLVYRAELRDVAQIGVVDMLWVPDDADVLRQQLVVPSPGSVPIIPASGLVLLKLIAWRPQDRVDIQTLLATGLDVDGIAAFLRTHAPHLVDRFSSLVPD